MKYADNSTAHSFSASGERIGTIWVALVPAVSVALTFSSTQKNSSPTLLRSRRSQAVGCVHVTRPDSANVAVLESVPSTADNVVQPAPPFQYEAVSVEATAFTESSN